MKLKHLIKVFINQGPGYFFYRSFYELRRKIGLLKFSFPVNPISPTYPTLDEWKNKQIPFFFSSRDDLSFQKNPSTELRADYEKIKNSEIQLFNHKWVHISDWLTNPDSNYRYNKNKHWTEIEDITEEAGDIKFVWEKSRFSFLHTIMRYDYHFDEDSSSFVFDQIADWIYNNPINQGPNYKCSQEISLRCMNWIFALHFYKNSSQFTEELWQKIIYAIYWQIKHVKGNINFSRICVRNNHAITETLMLYLAGLLFPFFKEAKIWKSKGLEWLEQEINYQIYDDGTYLQFSHNYERVLVQLLSWTLRISDIHNVPLKSETKNRARQVINYMTHNTVGEEGQMPNYGSNDGALFFKLANQKYTDFRPQINALNATLNNQHLYVDQRIQEEAFWYGLEHLEIDEVTIDYGIKAFESGGIYTINDKTDKSFTFFKCSRYKDRPAHADNMHLDIWVNGQNYLRDSGTYKYNTEQKIIEYFAGTMGHNALMVDHYHQMQKGSRFIWYNWTKKAKASYTSYEQKYSINAKATMFQELSPEIVHERKVEKIKNQLQWQINDQIYNLKGDHTLRQYWHPHPDLQSKIGLEAEDEVGKRLELHVSSGYWSDHYGLKKAVSIWYFETTTRSIKTILKINI